MKNKKQFTLIELIIVIVVIGILAAMALPKFNGVVRGAKLAAMINDKEVLEKTLVMYYQKYDTLPLLDEDQELIVQNEGISLSKIVLAEEVKSNDIDTIYISLQETLKHYNDSEDSLYKIDLNDLKDSLSKKIKYGYKKDYKDFYVYSTKTGNVYYYDYLVNGNGTIQHSEYDTLLKNSELVTKTISPSLSGEETIINNKPIIELTTNLENVNTDTIINWEYTFIDEDIVPTKISFMLNNIEYDSFDKISTKLDVGDYTIKLKIQDSKGLWSDEIIKDFIVEYKIKVKYENVAVGEYFTMVIGKDNSIYTFGSNSSGQLGVGDREKHTIPQKVVLPNGEKPISVYARYEHSLAISEKGNIYTWGYNLYGELGEKANKVQTTPELFYINNDEKILSIFLGMYHSMIITDKGNLYSWGQNSSGQLGIGNTINQTVPQLVTIPNNEKPIDIALGGYFSMIITNKGNLYSCGYNGDGQLGLGNKTNQNTLQLVTLPNDENPVSIKSGYEFSVLTTDKGNIYSWGNNDSGRLGIGKNVDQTKPQKVTLPNGEKPTSIYVGFSNTMAITDKENIYAWGYNASSQLGLGFISNPVEIPQKVTLPNGEKPKSIYLGSSHSILLTKSGNLYGTGSNYDGKLGIDNVEQCLTFTKMKSF